MKRLEDTQEKWRIQRYVEKNPGCCKEDVVSGLHSGVGRNVVLDNITALIDEGKLIAIKGNQIYQLYINKGNHVASLISDIQCFDNSFYALLGNVIIKLRELEKRKPNSLSDHQRHEIDLVENRLLHAIFDIYRWFAYHHDVLRNTNFLYDYDKETLGKIHSTVSSAIREIQAMLLDTFSEVPAWDRIDLTHLDHCNPFEDNIVTFYLIKRAFDTNELAVPLEGVMDIMWKVSSKSPNFRHSRTLEFYSPTISVLEVNDWKKVLSAYEEVFENPMVINVKYQQRKLMYDLPLLES